MVDQCSFEPSPSKRTDLAFTASCRSGLGRSVRGRSLASGGKIKRRWPVDEVSSLDGPERQLRDLPEAVSGRSELSEETANASRFLDRAR